MIRLFILLLSFVSACSAQPNETTKLLLGAERLDLVLPKLEGKRIGLLVNQTSLVSKTHLVDTLLSRGVDVRKIFSPEHGFRGNAADGEIVNDEMDSRTGLPIVSLYGSNRKPTAAQLEDVDIVLFDIQDVGTRFYTYISTMHYLMEACASNGKKVMILDRPNPNGYVDGPVMQPEFMSFVGMHPIPILHGLTVGELALMINGEKWLEDGLTCDVEVITLSNYTHDTPYALPVKPSPNLPTDQSIAWYPSLCLFEGTSISVGRGTQSPFETIGHPDLTKYSFSFTPVDIPGMSVNPPHEGEICYGINLKEIAPVPLTLKYLIQFYNEIPNKDQFFLPYFERLVGTDVLREQIRSGMSEEEIRATWEPELNEYKAMREKYLLYP